MSRKSTLSPIILLSFKRLMTKNIYKKEVKKILAFNVENVALLFDLQSVN